MMDSVRNNFEHPSDAPFLTASDLKSYTWATHSFESTPEMTVKWETLGRLSGKSGGMPFCRNSGQGKNSRGYILVVVFIEHTAPDRSH
jgi:hypothetical protein